jgi:hypothetical protein
LIWHLYLSRSPADHHRPSDSLLAYGLNVEKLDKWTELASSKNAKKIRARARKAAAAM